MFDLRLLDSGMHFLSSGSAGLLAYSLTSTISWSWSRKASRSRSRTLPREQVARSMFLFSLFSALFVAIGVHVCIDYFMGAYSPVWK